MAFSREVTYEIVESPHEAWSWERYEKVVNKEWETLLNHHEKQQEKDFHQFFEKHPCMLPWLYGEIGRGAHGMFPNALISQPVFIKGSSLRLTVIQLQQESNVDLTPLFEIKVFGERAKSITSYFHVEWQGGMTQDFNTVNSLFRIFQEDNPPWRERPPAQA